MTLKTLRYKIELKEKKLSDKYIDLDFAKLDIERQKRKGYCEAVFCEPKKDSELLEIFKAFKQNNQNVIGTRASQEQYDFLKKKLPEIQYDKQARVLTLIQNKIEKVGKVAICTAGTGDIPIAKEAGAVAQFYGSNVVEYFDIGIAGIHRLFDKIDEIRKANVIIAVAGMEGTLGGIITGLVDVPVIALPTSIGYGASFNGLSALLTMLNSCAEGMTVVNIDNGFSAGYSANLINRKIEGK